MVCDNVVWITGHAVLCGQGRWRSTTVGPGVHNGWPNNSAEYFEGWPFAFFALISVPALTADPDWRILHTYICIFAPGQFYTHYDCNKFHQWRSVKILIYFLQIAYYSNFRFTRHYNSRLKIIILSRYGKVVGVLPLPWESG